MSLQSNESILVVINPVSLMHPTYRADMPITAQFKRQGTDSRTMPLQLNATVRSNPKGADILRATDPSHDPSEAKALLRDNSGFVCYVGDYMIQIPYKDVLLGSIEVWDLNPRQEPLPGFSQLLCANGDSNVLGSYGLLKSLAKEAHGDVAATVSLCCAARKQRQEFDSRVLKNLRKKDE